jgi:hypothetical protein
MSTVSAEEALPSAQRCPLWPRPAEVDLDVGRRKSVAYLDPRLWVRALFPASVVLPALGAGWLLAVAADPPERVLNPYPPLAVAVLVTAHAVRARPLR